MDDRTAHWIEDRGIPVEIAAEHGLTSLNGHPAFRFTDAQGGLLYHKVRLARPDGSKTFRRDRKGAPAALFNLACLDEELPTEDTPLIICEGEVDCLSWIAAGATHVVSVPDGAQRDTPTEGDIHPEEDSGFHWLWGDDGKLLPGLRKFRKIILATDEDKAGRILRQDLVIRLGDVRCWWLPNGYGEGCKDANDALRRYGVDHLMSLLADVRPVKTSSIVGMADLSMPLEKPHWPVHWNVLKPHIALTAPELVVVSGEPGAGKSQWALGLLMEMARLHKVRSFVVQFEDDPVRLKDDAIDYARAWSRVGNSHQPNCGDDPEAWVNSKLFTIDTPDFDEDEPDATIDWIKSQVEVAVFQYGCKIVMIDPWNEIQHAYARNMSETQYVNEALRSLKNWAKHLGVCLVIVTHPGKQIQSKDIDEISLYDISGSAAWNNKADLGIMLKRVNVDDGCTQSDMVDVKVCKVKNQNRMGRPGKAVLNFDRDRKIYT